MTSSFWYFGWHVGTGIGSQALGVKFVCFNHQTWPLYSKDSCGVLPANAPRILSNISPDICQWNFSSLPLEVTQWIIPKIVRKILHEFLWEFLQKLYRVLKKVYKNTPGIFPEIFPEIFRKVHSAFFTGFARNF